MTPPVPSDDSAGAGQSRGDQSPVTLDVEALRSVPGCPEGSDSAIRAMSSPPAHTACPNPFADEWASAAIGEAGERTNPGPYASDSTSGKTSLVYKAHSFPTKVPHEAIMRLILHYTAPGDLVLDGFCGSGMTGVAAQMCGSPSMKLRTEIEAELGPVAWGSRTAYLQDLSPSATFIAAGLNLPVDAGAFDRASANLLKRFDDQWGWMYETVVEDGGKTFTAQIEYTIWSEVRTCPSCGGRVVLYEDAFDQASMSIRDEFPCGHCGALTTKRRLTKRKVSVRTLGGRLVERLEYIPVALKWRAGKLGGIKPIDEADANVLRRVAIETAKWFPTGPLPYMHMTHERGPIAKDGFDSVELFWSDRALLALSVLWALAHEESRPDTRRALLFWIEQAFWGFSWMNRYRPDGYSQVSQYQSGVYYIASLHSEPSPRYNLEGSAPGRGKRQLLVKLWRTLSTNPENVRISTGSSTHLLLPDASVDYVFVDPPFGENIYYSDLSYLVESWHQVFTAPVEEAIIDKNKRRTKGLPEYEELIEACFREFNRVLKPGRWMTVEFSNSSNDVWLAIQHALSRAGFVVADTRVFDKEQHSFRQVTATNAVKRDLIISAYKPAAGTAEKVALAKGSEEGVRAFLTDHLAHLPVTAGRRGDARVVRERQADRLFDRMVAYHVGREIGVPMTVAEYNAALDRWFILRDGMYFLPAQAEEWERFRITFRDLDQAELFITGESSAVQWLRQLLRRRALPYSEIQPAFFAETQKGSISWDELPDLLHLLEQNFVQSESRAWGVPDTKKAEHLEQLRTRELLRIFDGYKNRRGTLDRFRSEAVRAGFKQAWATRDFASVVAVGRRLPTDAFADDPALLHYFRNAERMLE